MLLALSLAHAADMQIHVRLAGMEPVFTTIHDVAPGSVQHIEFPGQGRTRYALDTRVEQPSDGYDWRVKFQISSMEVHGKRRSERKVLTQPTMMTHSNELAQFLQGGTETVSVDPLVEVFHGMSIDWIVSTEPRAK